MDKIPPHTLRYICFANVYEHNIERKIKEIDLFIKTSPPPYKAEDISDLLHINLDELYSILEVEYCDSLDMLSFFKLIRTSSSYICRLIQRQCEYYDIKYYTPEVISYIYELNIDKVRKAFKESSLLCVESHNLKEIFSYIYVPVVNLNY
ncbi:MAG: hypothetical protein GX366_07830 [Epulopiscium sp.]|nr:hypothetical protein [Candidatus Epulonipiscium sp.]